MPELVRLCCIAPFCRRTAPADRHPGCDEIICAEHWRALPPQLKACRRRARAAVRTLSVADEAVRLRSTACANAQVFRPASGIHPLEAARWRAVHCLIAAQRRDQRLWRFGRTTPPATVASGRVAKEAVSLGRRYSRGSIGAAWQEWIRREEWGALALSNRTEIWWPVCGKRIEPVFGDVRPDTATMKQMSEWHAAVAGKFGVDAAYKAMKVWRALWGVLQASRHTQLTERSKKVADTVPKPRSMRHEVASALHLAKTAWRRGCRGLACIVIVCWDAGFKPGSARTARARHLGTDPTNKRLIIDRTADGRAKTGAPVIGTLSRLGDAMVRSYLKELGVEMLGEALLFRTRRGQPYRDTVLSHDFADVRAMVDLEDRRQLRDMRRSATTEAFRGGAESKAVPQKFGNSIDRSAFLFKTNNPFDLEQVQ